MFLKISCASWVVWLRPRVSTTLNSAFTFQAACSSLHFRPSSRSPSMAARTWPLSCARSSYIKSAVQCDLCLPAYKSLASATSTAPSARHTKPKTSRSHKSPHGGHCILNFKITSCSISSSFLNVVAKLLEACARATSCRASAAWSRTAARWRRTPLPTDNAVCISLKSNLSVLKSSASLALIFESCFSARPWITTLTLPSSSFN
mmetsp:Transcript_14335/g.46289  ORF Transcript_14335/g.46289 Transcript_14335/m.46289 type:complete len:205 (-) Transcript_14335:271-885(-)